MGVGYSFFLLRRGHGHAQIFGHAQNFGHAQYVVSSSLFHFMILFLSERRAWKHGQWTRTISSVFVLFFIFFFREEGVEARAMDTHNFSAGPLPDYFEKEFGSLGNASHPYNGSLHALEFQCVFTTSLLHIFTTSVFTTYY